MVKPSYVGMTKRPVPEQLQPQRGLPAVTHSRPFLKCGDPRSPMNYSEMSAGAQMSPGQARKLGSVSRQCDEPGEWEEG
ncbi:hypothetical protein NDU88_000990 [Pleurodeles waltl]|uniref:Uncharacterized protein n=1 Tax=Pleurodeles waltl TaxID=8319 RepID=A0AAV7WH34_PLEWA|nr:hypothetical protein NDU88_000990 [Pleurodeles waltl]